MEKNTRLNAVLFIASVLLVSCDRKSQETTENLPDSTILRTATEAYTFGIPLVLMDITRQKMTDPSNKDAAPENSFAHKSVFPDASFRDVVRPNADTYYSTASLNLSKEPVILSLPDTRGRYYMMPMLDAYTNVFASPGTRTTGNGEHTFFISGPGWEGQTPAGMIEIKAPTNMVWIIGRTQVNSENDGKTVVIPLQQKYTLTPLSAWGATTASTAKSTSNPAPVPQGSPNDIAKAMPIDTFFNYMNRLMVANPPAPADTSALKKFEAIGIAPGAKFDMDRFSPSVREALLKIPANFFSSVEAHFMQAGKLVNGWNPMRSTQGAYGIDYKTRAVVAYAGLGANLKEDAMYPSASYDEDGIQLNGTNKYVIHFEKGNTPPANAFWSLTLYDPDGYMVANPINRNAIGDRSNLKANQDGSVDIFIQHDDPGKETQRNWLPAPSGDFNILLRVYWPKEQLLNGNWTPPAIKKVN